MWQTWSRPAELTVLLGVLAIVAMTWVFIKLADEVVDGETNAFDLRLLEALRDPDNPRLPRGPVWLREAGRDITALGSGTVLTLLTLAVAVYLLLQRLYRAMWLMLLAVGSGAVLSTLLKQFFARPRPEAGSDLTTVISYSFPSGHSMLSAVVYLTLGTMLAQMEKRWALKLYFLLTAMLLTVLVGLSRIYLGVHYPTDVLAGWSAGLAWAILWWLIARTLQRRGSIEPSRKM